MKSEEKKVYKRIFSLVEEQSFIEIDKSTKVGVVIGFGYIDKKPVYIFAQDPDENHGAVSRSHCEKIIKVYDLALKTGLPVVGIYDSNGAKLSESAELMKSYSRVIEKSNKLSGILPQVSVVLGPCLGAMSLIAMSADFVIMSKDAEIGIRNDGEYYSSEEALKRGLIQIKSATELTSLIAARQLISMVPSNNIDVLNFEEDKENGHSYTENNFIDIVADGGLFIELQKIYGKSLKVGLARFGGITVGIIASESEIIDADSCLKAMRLIRFCDSFSIPVITFIDALKFESLREASMLTNVYAESTAIKVTVVVGKAYGSVCLAFCGEAVDFCIALKDASLSLLEPKTYVAAFSCDELKNSDNPVEEREKLINDYAENEASAEAAAQSGIVNDVVTIEEMRESLFSILEIMSSKRVRTLPKKHSAI